MGHLKWRNEKKEAYYYTHTKHLKTSDAFQLQPNFRSCLLVFWWILRVDVIICVECIQIFFILESFGYKLHRRALTSLACQTRNQFLMNIDEMLFFSPHQCTHFWLNGLKTSLFQTNLNIFASVTIHRTRWKIVLCHFMRCWK